MTKRFRLSLAFLIVVWLASACIPSSDAPSPQGTQSALPAQETGQPKATDLPLPDWISIYFTNPDDPNAGSFRGGPDAALAEAIQGARMRVDVAIYHLNLWSIRDALLDAHRRGVQVRMVTESDNMDEEEIQQLIEAGIPVLGDRRESLMHNKFVVIDGAEVWTGSMNFTTTGAYRNDNALLRIRSSRLAENYTAEFEEMFLEDHFGDDIGSATPNPSLTINGVQIETYFSPDDGVAEHIKALIDSAASSIDFLAYSFTLDTLADAILAQATKGAAIRGVLEENQYYSNIGTDFDRFVNHGLDVNLDGNRYNMHHKTIILDDATVITGSYNFSRSAEMRNDENVLVIHCPQVAEKFEGEFMRIYQKAQP